LKISVIPGWCASTRAGIPKSVDDRDSRVRANARPGTTAGLPNGNAAAEVAWIACFDVAAHIFALAADSAANESN
jgi:hypothetical protein